MPKVKISSQQKKLYGLTFLSVVFFILLFSFVSAQVNYSDIKQAVLSLNATQWIIVLSLSMVNYVGRFIRWLSYIQILQPNSINKLTHFLIYCIGFAYCTTPGKAGEAVRTLYLNKYSIKHGVTISALLMERILDLAVMVLLSLLLFAFIDLSAEILALLILSIVLGILFILFWRKVPLIKKIAEYILVKSKGFFQGMSLLLNGTTVSKGILIGVLSWGAEGVGLYLILQYLGVQLDVLLLVAIYAAATLAGALSFIPGGLGGAEAVMILLLTFVGVSPEIAIASTLICRLATLWFAVIFGFVCLLTYHLFIKRKNITLGFRDEL